VRTKKGSREEQSLLYYAAKKKKGTSEIDIRLNVVLGGRSGKERSRKTVAHMGGGGEKANHLVPARIGQKRGGHAWRQRERRKAALGKAVLCPKKKQNALLRRGEKGVSAKRQGNSRRRARNGFLAGRGKMCVKTEGEWGRTRGGTRGGKKSDPLRRGQKAGEVIGIVF